MTRNNDLNDPLDDLFNNSAESNVVPLRQRPTPPASYEQQGTSFDSGARGYERQGRRSTPGGRRTGRVLGAVIQEWIHEHRAESEWMTEAARRNEERRGKFDFPQAMLNALAKYGSLTDNQLAAVRKCMARNAQREEARALAAVAEAGVNTVACDVFKLEAAFQRARDSAAQDREGLKFLHLRLDTFIFSPAGAHSRNPGAIYVKEEGTYLGKVQDGRFKRSGDCGDDQERRIVVAASDPAAAAKLYGLRTGSCSICGRELTNRASIDLGIGPICAARWGF